MEAVKVTSPCASNLLSNGNLQGEAQVADLRQQLRRQQAEVDRLQAELTSTKQHSSSQTSALQKELQQKTAALVCFHTCSASFWGPYMYSNPAQLCTHLQSQRTVSCCMGMQKGDITWQAFTQHQVTAVWVCDVPSSYSNSLYDVTVHCDGITCSQLAMPYGYVGTPP